MQAEVVPLHTCAAQSYMVVSVSTCSVSDSKGVAGDVSTCVVKTTTFLPSSPSARGKVLRTQKLKSPVPRIPVYYLFLCLATSRSACILACFLCRRDVEHAHVCLPVWFGFTPFRLLQTCKCRVCCAVNQAITGDFFLSLDNHKDGRAWSAAGEGGGGEGGVSIGRLVFFGLSWLWKPCRMLSPSGSPSHTGTHRLVRSPSHTGTRRLVRSPSHTGTHRLVRSPSHTGTHRLVRSPSHTGTQRLVFEAIEVLTFWLSKPQRHTPSGYLSHRGTHRLVRSPSHRGTHRLVLQATDAHTVWFCKPQRHTPSGSPSHKDTQRLVLQATEALTVWFDLQATEAHTVWFDLQATEAHRRNEVTMGSF